MKVASSVVRFRDALPPGERLKYLFWRFSLGCFPVELKMKSGAILPLRTWQYHDYHTAYEVFVAEFYNTSLNDAKTVVDLGANVGYATLYFALRYKYAKLYSFEPHPKHFECLSHLIRLNKLESRVTLYNAAASTGNRLGVLSDQGTCSTLVDVSKDCTCIQAEVIDIFEWSKKIGGIDILKMDIEGGEHAILRDPRFAQLDCRSIVMEYHPTSDCTAAASAVLARMAETGYRAEVFTTMPLGVGIIHAEKT